MHRSRSASEEQAQAQVSAERSRHVLADKIEEHATVPAGGTGPTDEPAQKRAASAAEQPETSLLTESRRDSSAHPSLPIAAPGAVPMSAPHDDSHELSSEEHKHEQVRHASPTHAVTEKEGGHGSPAAQPKAGSSTDAGMSPTGHVLGYMHMHHSRDWANRTRPGTAMSRPSSASRSRHQVLHIHMHAPWETPVTGCPPATSPYHPDASLGAGQCSSPSLA